MLIQEGTENKERRIKEIQIKLKQIKAIEVWIHEIYKKLEEIQELIENEIPEYEELLIEGISLSREEWELRGIIGSKELKDGKEEIEFKNGYVEIRKELTMCE